MATVTKFGQFIFESSQVHYYYAYPTQNVVVQDFSVGVSISTGAHSLEMLGIGKLRLDYQDEK